MNINILADKAAEQIYLKMNSYANPSMMNDIEKSWIISKIKEGLIEFISHTEIIIVYRKDKP